MKYALFFGGLSLGTILGFLLCSLFVWPLITNLNATVAELRKIINSGNPTAKEKG